MYMFVTLFVFAGALALFAFIARSNLRVWMKGVLGVLLLLALNAVTTYLDTH